MKQALIELVIKQIEYDLSVGDVTAIEELLSKLDNETLSSFLSFNITLSKCETKE